MHNLKNRQYSFYFPVNKVEKNHEMLFLVFIIASVAVISGDLVAVTFDFEEDYKDIFSDRQCVNSTQWDLVSYEDLALVPPYEGRSKAIRSLRNSCTASFPIVFLNGTLEVSVYLRTISQNSGVTISVFEERDEAISSVRYQRSSKNYMPGWVVITVPVQKRTTGYVQISGQSLDSELVLVDSLQNIPGNLTYSENYIIDKRPLSDEAKSAPSTNSLNDANNPDEFIFDFNEGESFDYEEGEDIDGSGDTEPPVTEGPDIPTEGPDTGTEDPDNITPGPNPEEDNRNSDGNDFWNAFSITFVSVGAFTAVGLLGVGSYYLGKNRGVSQNPLLDVENLEAPTPSIIPRARSTFPDDTYDSFSRYS